MSISPCVDSNGAPVTSYILYVKELNIGALQAIHTFNLGDTLEHTLTVADDGLTPGSLLYFQYTSVNTVGESEMSNEVFFALAVYPDAPLNLVKVDNMSSMTSIYLNWDIQDDYETNVIGYQVWMESDQNGEFVLAYDGTNFPGVNYYDSTGLTTGNSYSYKLTSLNVNGAGAFTSPLVFYSCLPPTDILPPVFVSSTKTTMTLDWTYPTATNGCPLEKF